MQRQRDRSWLDAQYNNRARVPNYQEHLHAWARDSAALRAEGGAILDLAYGQSEGQAVDLFRPTGEPAPPLVVFVHGGYWQALDRKHFSFIARPFLERGVATAVVGYDLAPRVTVGEIVDQVRRALVFLHRKGDVLAVDVSRIVVTGHSAGGHLAAMALATPWQAFEISGEAGPDGRKGSVPGDLLKGVVAISGLFDLEPIRLCYLNDVLGLDQTQAARLSPIHLTPTSVSIPVLVTVGGTESEEFLLQSECYVSHLRNYMKRVEHRIEAGLDHFEIVGRFGSPDEPMVERTLSMLGR